jgi:hypothetical protein
MKTTLPKRLRRGTWCECRDNTCGHITSETRMNADLDRERCGSPAIRMVTVFAPHFPYPYAFRSVEVPMCAKCAEYREAKEAAMQGGQKTKAETRA